MEDISEKAPLYGREEPKEEKSKDLQKDFEEDIRRNLDASLKKQADLLTGPALQRHEEPLREKNMTPEEIESKGEFMQVDDQKIHVPQEERLKIREARKEFEKENKVIQEERDELLGLN